MHAIIIIVVAAGGGGTGISVGSIAYASENQLTRMNDCVEAFAFLTDARRPVRTHTASTSAS